eukprot:4345784-Pyramimonas_sp.AAC.1
MAEQPANAEPIGGWMKEGPADKAEREAIAESVRMQLESKEKATQEAEDRMKAVAASLAEKKKQDDAEKELLAAIEESRN